MTLLPSDPGIALRQWVHFQGVHNILDLLSWDQEELKAVPAQQVYSLDDHGQGLYLRTNQIKQICGLITYMKHVSAAYNSDIDPRDDPFHPFTPDEWSQQTSTMLRTYLAVLGRRQVGRRILYSRARIKLLSESSMHRKSPFY